MPTTAQRRLHQRNPYARAPRTHDVTRWKHALGTGLPTRGCPHTCLTPQAAFIPKARPSQAPSQSTPKVCVGTPNTRAHPPWGAGLAPVSDAHLHPRSCVPQPQPRCGAELISTHSSMHRVRTFSRSPGTAGTRRHEHVTLVKWCARVVEPTGLRSKCIPSH